ncbi:hypothetical protein ACJX0J_027002 [Zea mays]
MDGVVTSKAEISELYREAFAQEENKLTKQPADQGNNRDIYLQHRNHCLCIFSGRLYLLIWMPQIIVLVLFAIFCIFEIHGRITIWLTKILYDHFTSLKLGVDRIHSLLSKTNTVYTIV